MLVIIGSDTEIIRGRARHTGPRNPRSFCPTRASITDGTAPLPLTPLESTFAAIEPRPSETRPPQHRCTLQLRIPFVSLATEPDYLITAQPARSATADS